ncbi:hypothetical protein GCM10023403_02190 [Pseudonocardia benzenivorans]
MAGRAPAPGDAHPGHARGRCPAHTHRSLRADLLAARSGPYLSVALWAGLTNVMDGSWAGLIVAAVWAVIAAVGYAIGRSNLRRTNPTPDPRTDRRHARAGSRRPEEPVRRTPLTPPTTTRSPPPRTTIPLVSSLLPATRQEQDLAEQVKDKPVEAGQPLGGQAQEKTKELVENLREPAQQSAQSVQQTAQDAASTVQEEGRSAAQDVRTRAQDAGGTVKETTGR